MHYSIQKFTYYDLNKIVNSVITLRLSTSREEEPSHSRATSTTRPPSLSPLLLVLPLHPHRQTRVLRRDAREGRKRPPWRSQCPVQRSALPSSANRRKRSTTAAFICVLRWSAPPLFLPSSPSSPLSLPSLASRCSRLLSAVSRALLWLLLRGDAAGAGIHASRCVSCAQIPRPLSHLHPSPPIKSCAAVATLDHGQQLQAPTRRRERERPVCEARAPLATTDAGT